MRTFFVLICLALPTPLLAQEGALPTDPKSGKPLNLDFEAGSLRDWKAEGEAFARSLVEGDAVARRRGDMKSEHQGKFWVGSYEADGDDPHGTLTSAPFVVTKPWASFLVGGGSHKGTRVELVRSDDGQVIFEARGDETENLKPVAADLSKNRGQTIFVRLVDQDSSGWGHVNFDNFRLHDARPNVPERAKYVAADVHANNGLSPLDAAKAMTVPAGFRVELFAGEPDVVQPIAFAIDDRGRLWVAEAYSYPHRVAPDQARDRILIFEDTDGDGRFDERKVFADKLNLVSGLEVGFGGVWVGAAPEFLFIPDKDGDDRPDGPPQVILDGWGQHDTHETLNSFAWGPDGWLYGCHGVFTHSLVGKPGTPEANRVGINAGIWRYHPTKDKFEVFAHGTSNPWGIDWDENGDAFITSCVIPHLYEMIPGGRYERQAGPHFNPFTYDDIKTIADHRHYVGGNPHAGNGRSDSMGGGHAHSGAMIYLGGAWPKEYRGSLFMNNIHGARLNRDILAPKGSGFVGSHAPDFLFANDSWSQIVSLKYGPDGNAYMIDWYDKNQCHRVEDGAHDRTNGRIFKVVYGDAKVRPVDLRKMSTAELVTLQKSDNEWKARHARRILQERGNDPEARALLKTLSSEAAEDAQVQIRALLTARAVGGMREDSEIATALANPEPHYRSWAVRLAVEDGEPSAAILARFVEMAKADASPVVRLSLASALQRLPLGKRWDVLAGLLGHAEDANDPNLPLMTWYAAEPLAAADASRAMALALSSKLPNTLPFMTRRVASLGTDEAIALLVDVLGKATSGDQKAALLGGIDEALKGRRQAAMPKGWPAVSRALAKESDEGLRSRAVLLGVTFGDPSALAQVRKSLEDGRAETSRRLAALTTLLKVHDPELSATLRDLVAKAETDPALRGPAIRGLAAYDDAETPALLLKAYPDLTTADKRDALNTLAARPRSARAMLDAVAVKTIAPSELSADLIRQLRNLKDDSVNSRIAEVWGAVRDTDPDKSRLITKYRGIVRAGYTGAPDVMLGRAMYAKTCSQCHTLFGTGGKVGPELTGSNRADLEYVLSNVLDPNALIGKDYLAHVIATKDGRTLTGIVRAEDKDAITLVTANETVIVPKGEIDERKLSDKSMMPDDLWTPLTDFEVRSLVAYLASPNQVPLLATPETAKAFFNGKDLSGWQGDPKLWSVEDGEIVGRTTGLKRNEFLRSELAAEDFRLSFEVKLVKNEGNSGLQFRSQSLADGEMKGDQADIGAGWWGKLYEENGRGLLWDKSGEAFVKPGDWNTYEVVAIGPKIVTRINGKTCVDLNDPAGARRGIFGFQLHSGGPTEVRFRKIQLDLESKSATK